MSEYNLGRVTPIFCGDWGNQTVYKYLDVVLYGGASYVSKGDTPAGALPTDTNYWQLVAKGAEITPEMIEQIAELVKQRMGDDFVQDPDYVHTDNNLTDELVEKIEESGNEPLVIYENRDGGEYTEHNIEVYNQWVEYLDSPDGKSSPVVVFIDSNKNHIL